jgi:hypothetical protein
MERVDKSWEKTSNIPPSGVVTVIELNCGKVNLE